MNRTTVIRSVVAFLAGAACSLAGVQVWLNQPEQILVLQAYQGRLDAPRPVSSRAITPITSMDDIDTPEGWPDSRSSVSFVPLIPAVSWTSDKIDSVCAYYEPLNPSLNISITPTEAAAHEMRDNFGGYLNEGGSGPSYAVMLDRYSILYTFETNGPQLYKFDQQTASGQSTAADFTRIDFNMDAAYISVGLDYLYQMSETHPVEKCHSDFLDPANHDALDALFEKRFGKEAVQHIRSGTTP